MASKKSKLSASVGTGKITGNLVVTTPEGKALEKQEKQQKAVQTAQQQAAGVIPGTYSTDYVTQQATQIDPYQSAWMDIIKERADKIANRDPFSYNFNEDPLYQNYKDQYMRQATLGQESAMANAAALSGGYGNSYAATAGNLAYQENMAHLNDVIPQLYQMAYDKYNTDLANERADLEMYQNMDNNDYGRYRDTVADTQWGDQFRANQYDSMKNYTATEHQRGIDNDLNSKQLAEQIRSNKAQEKLDKKKFAWDKKTWKKEYDLRKKASAGGSSGGGGGRSYGRSSSGNPGGIPTAVYNVIRKYKGGNDSQGEIAGNVLTNLKSKYNLTDAQCDYLYNTYLGFNDKQQKRRSDNKVYTSNVALTRSQAIKKGAPDSTLSEAKWRDRCAEEARSGGKKKYSKYNSYDAYLKAMIKKGK